MENPSGWHETFPSPTAVVVSGFVAGLLVVLIGFLANVIGQPFPPPSMFGPAIPPCAAALAAAVASHRSGASIGTTLALAAGTFLVTYFISVWVTSWMGIGSMARRRPLNPVVLGWRRDLAVCFFGIAIGSFLGNFLGRP